MGATYDFTCRQCEHRFSGTEPGKERFFLDWRRCEICGASRTVADLIKQGRDLNECGCGGLLSLVKWAPETRRCPKCKSSDVERGEATAVSD